EVPHGLEAYIYFHRGKAFEGLAISDLKPNSEYFSKALADYDEAIKLAPKYEEARKQRESLLQR
ncbi:MAG TPA: hypothetical protein VMM54_08315, partial [Nitrospirota bacterium]|nr:hypothetical protein [Nitrospirota bacterium]